MVRRISGQVVAVKRIVVGMRALRWRGVAEAMQRLRWRQVTPVIRRIDIRKPVHAVVIGVVVAGIVAPVADWLATNERYRVTQPMTVVAERPSPKLMEKLRYDREKRANVFNAEGQTDVKAGMKDQLQAAMGAGGKKDKQLYTATMPDDPRRGIDVHDNVNDISVKFVPQMELMDGRSKEGRVSYPLKGQAGQMIFTPKANGLKEDIVLTGPPKDDVMDFRYQLEYPDSVETRLEENGSIGFYTGSPELFGNISYGTDNDRELVQKARVNAAKTYLMFSIPAPVIRETGKRSAVSARFDLRGKELVVHVEGLTKAYYPLSIDPTFLLQSTADFVLGSTDDNIDLSVANQVGRATLSGGSTPNWAPNGPSMSNGNYAAALVAYNSYLYYLGGGNRDGTTANTTTNQIMYVHLNADGSTDANWTIPNNATCGCYLQTARQGHVGFGFNGYLYVAGGQDNNANSISSVEFAKINSDGSVGAWHYTGHLSSARGYLAGAIYQGVLYAMGGASGNFNSSLLDSTEYVRINGDGTLGDCGTPVDQYKSGCTWNAGTSLGSGARNRLVGAAYNGFVYVTGGRTAAGAVLNTVEAAAINSDGSLGSWRTTGMTAFPTARRDHGMGVQNGHIYVYGGCSSGTIACPTFLGDTQYAVINADGTIGQWQSTVPYNNGGFAARTNPSSAFYNNFLYFVGGCAAENASSIHCNVASGFRTGAFYTGFDTPGRFDRGIQTISTTPPYDNNAPGTPRYYAQAVALNGYLYYIGGCRSSCTSYSTLVDYAPVNANGTVGTWGAATALTSGDGNTAGRTGHTVLVYNNKIYVIGGVELNGTTDVYMSSVLSNSQNSDGTLSGTWTREANAMPAGQAFSTSVLWHDRIYVLGGRGSSTVSGNIYTTQIGAGGALGTWSTSGTTIAARWGHYGGIWGNWIYVAGGMNTATGTYTWIANTVAANAVQKLTINNDGTLSATVDAYASGAATGDRRAYAGGFVHNGYLYSFGGRLNATATATASIYWASLDAGTGAPSAFSAANIGNMGSATAGLATARSGASAVTYGGNIYVMGGCTAGGSTSNFKVCSTIVSIANTTELFLPNNGGTGQINTFSSATSLPVATADHTTVAYNGYLYQVGGCTGYTAGVCSVGSNSATIRYAQINPDNSTPGSLGSWVTSATSLPEGRSLLQAVAYNGYLYVVGGQTDSNAAVAAVTYTNIASTGALGGSWSNVNLPAGAERNAAGVAVLNGYLYVAGGDNGSGTKKNDVYYAQLNTTDGSLAAPWATTSSFTTARSGHSVVGYNGRLYVIGGTDGTNALSDVQFASQNADGTLGSFVYTTDVPRGMSFRQAVGANGYMYFIGNEGDNTEVTYAGINANGTLGMLQRSGNGMAASHAHGAVSWYDGYFYVLGGCALSGGACATPSASGEYAGQQVISRVGHYSKLYNTQVDTSPTQLLINGAINGPGAAVEFKLQTASSVDPILGVAQLIRPVIFNNFYNVQALNSSGTNVGVALNYLFLITLDDSRSATFPDVPYAGAGGYAQTAVTSINLYYHANPLRRLRHGASFTDTGCNPIPTNGCLLDTAP